ncbi:H-NS family nucleoid-associated regulatory protein [Cereibacter azotoformans]|uniref:H-NS histone family protein n=1 Tax=Cereibacter azotoformans TaxID=43057 RepID=UPI001F485677|nr:H-NS histone family protein [Cereibacter azotoformans]
MSAIDLNDLSLKELKSLQAQIAKAIATHEDRRRRQALEDLESRARQMGFTLAELVGGAPVRKRSAVPAQYANPLDPADTWSGRGRKPRWFLAAIAAGKSPDDLRI